VANFDRIAPLYRWMEYASFGPMLARCRNAHLAALGGARCALVYGDGDGRFLARLLRLHPALEVDAVDSSAAMLQLLRRQTNGLARLHHADALAFTPPAHGYDLVITHFFLDCFSNVEIERLLDRVTPQLASGARWLVSEFAIPPRGLRRVAAWAVVGGLYRAFGLLTGLAPRSLPDHAGALQRRGFRLEAERRLLGGLLITQLWRAG
jgi:ubiquinone/menaquinone biosynthesis C-methylase UbiE